MTRRATIQPTHNVPSDAYGRRRLPARPRAAVVRSTPTSGPTMGRSPIPVVARSPRSNSSALDACRRGAMTPPRSTTCVVPPMAAFKRWARSRRRFARRNAPSPYGPTNAASVNLRFRNASKGKTSCAGRCVSSRPRSLVATGGKFAGAGRRGRSAHQSRRRPYVGDESSCPARTRT